MRLRPSGLYVRVTQSCLSNRHRYHVPVYGLGMGAQFGIVLNNDITIRDPNWVEDAFIKHLRANPRQLMGARYIDFNGDAMYDGRHVTPYIEGWCVAFHRSFVENVGLFDGAIFNWHEDAELCIRAHTIHLLPTSTVMKSQGAD